MDTYLFKLLNDFADRFAWLDFFGILFAEYFGYILIILLVIILLVDYKKYWKMVAESVLAGVVSRFIITNIIRFLWQRPRPFDVMDVNLILKAKQEASFPSGHASFFFAISTIVFFYNKKLGYLFFSISILMSVGRVYVGYHWPLDILGGIVVGFLTAFAVNKLIKKYAIKENLLQSKEQNQ